MHEDLQPPAIEKIHRSAIILEDDPQQSTIYQELVTHYSPYDLQADSVHAHPRTLGPLQEGLYLLDCEIGEDPHAGIHAAEKLLEEALETSRTANLDDRKPFPLWDIVLWSSSPRLVREAEAYFAAYKERVSDWRQYISGLGYGAYRPIQIRLQLKSQEIGWHDFS